MSETSPPSPSEPVWYQFAQAPLMPPAVGAALGLILEHFGQLPLEAELCIAAVGLCCTWIIHSARSLCLMIAFMGLAAAHLHVQRYRFDPDDIGVFASEAPAVARVRGFLDEVPNVRIADRSELFGPARRIDRASTVLAATEISLGSEPWRPASGRARLIVERIVPNPERGLLDSLTIGTEVEAVGLLAKPSPPSNPGEADYAAYLRDHRIHAEIRVLKGTEAVVRLTDRPAWSIRRVLALLRARLTSVLQGTLSPSEVVLARALLLGDTTAADQDDWDAYARTGVLHVMAISGQHLVILAGAIWMLARLGGIDRKHGAMLVLLLIIGYASLTGGRPSAVRAAVMVGVFCIAVLARRTADGASSYCLAWLIVVAIQPADALSPGSLLSFISVFILLFGVSRWVVPRPRTPAEQLIHQARPRWVKIIRSAGWSLLALFLINLVLTLANTPLLIATHNIAPPISVIIGLPVILLTTVALLAGFGLLLIGLVLPLLATPLALICAGSLSLSRGIVLAADSLPGGTVYVPDPPLFWVAGFYLLLAALLLADRAWHVRLLMMLALWSLIGLFSGGRSIDELRVTFLSVGHGGCVVIETPDDRTLVYDAGTMAGPVAVKRIVAPYLWSRGIRRIDELFLSHADLDHYNGVPQLARRFPLGRVSLTPSFAEKALPEVAELLLTLERKNVPRRIVAAGEQFTAGDVTIEVLHPPMQGPAGSENERSLVLLLRHRGHTILLTGDLEKAGTTMLLAQPPRKTDVLQAPHHGSAAALPEALRQWARPSLIVVSRGPRTTGSSAILEAWDTWTHGAITLHSHGSGLSAETFRTRQRRILTP